MSFVTKLPHQDSNSHARAEPAVGMEFATALVGPGSLG
jgi:hypothetical protein